MIQCRTVDPILIRTHGDLIFLEEGKARALADLGKVTYDGHSPLARTHVLGLVDAAQPQAPTEGPRPPAPKQETVHYLERTRWMTHRAGRVRPRVLWVQDRSKLGGAELSNDTVVAVGESLGYDIATVSPGWFQQGLFAEADFAVVNNIHEFNANQFYSLQQLFFEQCLPFVKYEHDYRELKRLNVSRALFQRARLCVFLSPAHYAGHLAEITIGEHLELPLAIDTDFYQRRKTDAARDDKTVVPTPHKCGVELEAFMASRPDKEYILVGTRGDVHTPKGVTVTGIPSQSPEGMRKLFSEHALVVHLPSQRWAGERVVLEAQCCGAEVVMNENVGHASWKDSERDRKALETAPYTFWEKVGAACISP